MKKLFAILMSIMMIACFMPTMAFAAGGETTTPGVTEPSQNGEGESQTPVPGEAGGEENATYVAKIGETTYESLAAAIQAIGTVGVEGNRIELVSDTTLNAAITIEKNVTISGKNSNGENYKINGNSDIARSEFIVNKGTLQLEDLTLQNFGNNAATTAGIAVISVPVDAAADVKVVLRDNALAAATATAASTVCSVASFDVLKCACISLASFPEVLTGTAAKAANLRLCNDGLVNTAFTSAAYKPNVCSSGVLCLVAHLGKECVKKGLV